jgi:DNA-binding CsgD family transcriptional regulator
MFVDLAITHPKRLRDGAKEIMTDREKHVLRMLVTGLSNKEIGAPLGIGGYVKTHIAKMVRKVGYTTVSNCRYMQLLIRSSPCP